MIKSFATPAKFNGPPILGPYSRTVLPVLVFKTERPRPSNKLELFALELIAKGDITFQERQSDPDRERRRCQRRPSSHNHNCFSLPDGEVSRDCSLSSFHKLSLSDGSTNEANLLRSGSLSTRPTTRGSPLPSEKSLIQSLELGQLSMFTATAMLPELAAKVRGPKTEQVTDDKCPLKEVLCLSGDDTAFETHSNPALMAAHGPGAENRENVPPVQDTLGTEHILCTDYNARTLKVIDRYGYMHITAVTASLIAQTSGLSLATQCEWAHESLLDRAANSSVMSQSLFLDLQYRAQRAHLECDGLYQSPSVRPYTKASTQMVHAFSCPFQIRHMAANRPMYASEMEYLPLLLGYVLPLLQLLSVLAFSEEEFTLSTEKPAQDSLNLTDFVECDALTWKHPPVVKPMPPLNGGGVLQQQQTLVCPFLQGLLADTACNGVTDIPADAEGNNVTQKDRILKGNTCTDSPSVCVDICSYNKPPRQAKVELVWIDNTPARPLCFKLVAVISSILIALWCVSTHGNKGVVFCTDSNYTRLDYTHHLPNGRKNGFRTAELKPVKHKELVLARDHNKNTQDTQVYGKKVRNHSNLLGPAIVFNDETSALTKAGAVSNSAWDFVPGVLLSDSTLSGCVVLASSMAQSVTLATQRDPVVRETKQLPRRARKPRVPSADTRQTRRLAKVPQKSIYRKLSLPVKLQHKVTHDALLDTTADISVMSQSLFLDLQHRAQSAYREMHMLSQPIQPYAETSTQMHQVLLYLIQVEHLAVKHLTYVSELEHVPLLLERDLLLRRRPILNLSEGGFALSTSLLKPNPVDLTDFVKCDSIKDGRRHMVETVPTLDREVSLQRLQACACQGDTDTPAKARATELATEYVILKPTQYVCLFTNPEVSSLQTPPLFVRRLMSPLIYLSVLLLPILLCVCYAVAAQGGSTTHCRTSTPCKKGGSVGHSNHSGNFKIISQPNKAHVVLLRIHCALSCIMFAPPGQY